MLYKIRGGLSTMCVFFPNFFILCHTSELLLCATIELLLHIYEYKLCFVQLVPQSLMVSCVRLCDAVCSISFSPSGVSRWGFKNQNIQIHMASLSLNSIWCVCVRVREREDSFSLK